MYLNKFADGATPEDMTGTDEFRSLLTSAATLTGSRSVNDSTGTNVAQIVISGERRQTPHGVVMMPAFGQAYSDIEIAAVANYVTARFGAKASSLTAKAVAELRP